MPDTILAFLFVGIIAGFIAGRLMKREGRGIFGNMIIGVAGAYLGGFLFNIIGFTILEGIWGALLSAIIGSAILLSALELFQK